MSPRAVCRSSWQWLIQERGASRDSRAMGRRLIAPLSRPHPRACLTAALLITCGLLWTTAAVSAEPEPDYFIYHGQPKRLTLDSTQIAVRAISSAPASSRMSNVVSPGLASHGFAASDIVARPVSDWALLNAQNALRTVAAKAQSIVKSAAMPSKGAAIHALIASVLESGDPSVAFISPVFRDENGGVVLLSSRVLIGFKKDFRSAERQRLLAAVPEGATLEQTK